MVVREAYPFKAVLKPIFHLVGGRLNSDPLFELEGLAFLHLRILGDVRSHENADNGRNQEKQGAQDRKHEYLGMVLDHLLCGLTIQGDTTACPERSHRQL
jgi:hypothetical protein